MTIAFYSNEKLEHVGQTKETN